MSSFSLKRHHSLQEANLKNQNDFILGEMISAIIIKDLFEDNTRPILSLTQYPLTEALHPGAHELRDLRPLDEVGVTFLRVVGEIQGVLRDQ